MGRIIKIQDSIFTEKCITCGASAVIEQIPGGKYTVRCKASSRHYQTPPGLVDIDKWNSHNRKDPGADDKIKHLKNG